MNARAWVRRHICPSCRETEPVDRHPALKTLEESGAALDRIGSEVRRIREQVAVGPNPLLGNPPRPRHEGGR